MLVASKDSNNYCESQSDEEANNQRIGYDSLKKYYDKLKDLDKSLEKSKHKRQAPVAFLKKCEE